MGSWILDEIAEVERQIIAIRLKTEEKVALEEERVRSVEQRRQELLDAHELRLQEALEEHNRQMQNVVDKAEQEIEEAAAVRAKAEARARVSNDKAIALEARGRELEKEVTLLSSILESTIADHDKRYEELRMEADLRVSQTQEETDRVVRNASLYASEIQDTALAMIQDMHENSRAKVKDATSTSKERSKFKELCDMLESKASQDIRDEEYSVAKTRLFEEWLGAWIDATAVEHVRLAVPSPCSSTQDALMPSQLDRPRSVDRARALAEELTQGLPPPRPVTAP